MRNIKAITVGFLLTLLGSDTLHASESDIQEVTFKSVKQTVESAFGSLPKHPTHCYHFSFHTRSKSDTRCVLDSKTAEVNSELNKKIRCIGFPVFLAELLAHEFKANLTSEQLKQIMLSAANMSQQNAENIVRDMSTVRKIYGSLNTLPEESREDLGSLLLRNSVELTFIYKKLSKKFNAEFYLKQIKLAEENLAQWRFRNIAGLTDANERKVEFVPIDVIASMADYKNRIKELRSNLFGLINQTGFADFATTFAKNIAIDSQRPLNEAELNSAKKLFSEFSYPRQESTIKHLPKIYRTYGYISKYKPDSKVSILDICFLSPQELSELNSICSSDFDLTATTERLARANALLAEIIQSTCDRLGVKSNPVTQEKQKEESDDQPTIVEMEEPKN